MRKFERTIRAAFANLPRDKRIVIADALEEGFDAIRNDDNVMMDSGVDDYFHLIFMAVTAKTKSDMKVQP